MIKAGIKGTKGRSAFMGVAAALTIAAFSPHADAAATAVTAVNTVEYSQNFLLVQLVGGSNFVGKIGAGGACAAYDVNADTIKAWLSISQSAFLSGKRLLIYYTACGGENRIQGIDIWT